MKYNFVTVNFNTPELVDALIKSIYKNSGIPKEDINIIVFDNSDKRPFKSDDVIVLDNTKGQIIDFEKWLSTFPNKIDRKKTRNNYGSDKHCYTIEWLIHHIPGGFLLLDSDVLIKKPVKSFFNNKLPYVGYIEHYKKKKYHCRLLPYMCYLNTDFIVFNDIKYFDNKKNWSLQKDSPKKYDTGAAFISNLSKYKISGQNIPITNYILHLANSSWKKDLESQKQWLNENRLYYTVC